MDAKQRIGNVTAGALVAVALVIDGFQALLTLTVVGSVLATAVTFAAGFGFWLWFTILGVKYLGKNGSKNVFIGLVSVIAELVPFVNALPATTLGVVGIIMQTRMEDAKATTGKGADPRKIAAIARLAQMKAGRSQMLQAARTAREAQRMNRTGSAEEVS